MPSCAGVGAECRSVFGVGKILDCNCLGMSDRHRHKIPIHATILDLQVCPLLHHNLTATFFDRHAISRVVSTRPDDPSRVPTVAARRRDATHVVVQIKSDQEFSTGAASCVCKRAHVLSWAAACGALCLFLRRVGRLFTWALGRMGGSAQRDPLFYVLGNSASLEIM